MSVALRSFVSVLRNPGLRRLQLAWGLWVTVDWACTVAISVFAFSQGGPAAVGLLNLVRMLVAAITAPFTSGLGDRLPRRRLLVLVEVTLALILACCAAAILFHLPGAIVYALAVAFTIAAAPFRALQGALLPRLAQTPNELTASNLVGSTMEGAGTLIGPVLAGSLLVLGRPAGVFGVIAALSVVAALLVNGIATSPSVRLRPAPRSILAEATAGFATLARERDVRFLVSLFSAQTLVRGALNVLIVVVAVDTLHFGGGGVGVLFAALGAGGFLGSALSMRLVGQSRLAIWFGVGLILWGVPIALLSISAAAPLAILLLTVVGMGNAIEDVAGFSVLQRIAPDAVFARILGIFEALIRITGGLGSLAAGLLVSRLGSRASLVIVGAFLPLIVTITWRRLRHLDAVVQVPTGRIGLLQRSPLFAPLSMMALERLALRMHPEQVAAGTDIIAEGDPGSHFYIIEVGEVEVTYRASPVTRLGAGDHFGEIAILRATPRTASVRALSAVQLLRLESDDFLAAVSQHAGSASWLESNVASRLSRAGGG